MSDAPVANTTTDNPAGLPANTPSLGMNQPGNPPAMPEPTVYSGAGSGELGVNHPGTVDEPPDVMQPGLPSISSGIVGAVEEPGETF